MVPALSDPFSSGRLSLRNRIVATAHGTGLVRDGLALDGDADYWRRVSEGGVAMAIIGGTGVAPEATYRAGNVLEAWREEARPGLEARAQAITAGGAFAVQQLVHLGRETLGAPIWYHPVGPSAVRSPREPVLPRALSLEDVAGVVEGFVRSTTHVAEAGFDGVELHAAHGYLLAQFLSPEANARTDSYGGDRAGRVRLLAEIVSEIRALHPDFAVGVRLSLEPGLPLDELAAIIPVLAESAPVDWVNVTVGPRGEYVRDMGTEHPPLLGAFEQIRAVTDGPLIVSHAFRAREEIEAALVQGADLVGMARPFIADPDVARKYVERRDSEIRPCVSCNEDCRLFDPTLLCTVNPDLALPGEPHRRGKPLRVQPGVGRSGGRVVIVGGGPAGLECALALARGGRSDVVLFEAEDALGGGLARAARAPLRKGWARILNFYNAGLEKSSVELRLGSTPGVDDLRDAAEIVVSTGSRELLPDLPGSGHALTASQLIDAPERLAGAERVVVVDDGFGWWPGVNAVELAGEAGATDIAVLTPSGAFAVGVPAESRIQLLQRLRGLPLRTLSFLVPVALDGGGLEVQHRLSGARDHVPADVVVFVGERRSVAPPHGVPESARVQQIGDAVVPRRAAHAITEGRLAAEAILLREPQGARGPSPKLD